MLSDPGDKSRVNERDEKQFVGHTVHQKTCINYCSVFCSFCSLKSHKFP